MKKLANGFWFRGALLAVALLVASVCGGCGGVEEGVLVDEDVSRDDKDLYVKSTKVWSSLTIPVCWENPAAGNAAERGWVQDALRDSWEEVSGVRFSGWGTCRAGQKGIRIRIRDEGPHTKGLGTDLDGKAEGMVLNFTFNSWSTDCQTMRQFCIESIAVHEFGHALGFAHEQNRSDTPATCLKAPQGGNGDITVGQWDQHSVMNYCNPIWNNRGVPSAVDTIGAQLYYGRPATEVEIKKPGSSYCLDVPNGSTATGVRWQMYSCHGGDNQRYLLRRDRDGYYELRSGGTDRCLDLPQGWTTPHQHTCHGGDNQKWKLYHGYGETLQLRAKRDQSRCLSVTWDNRIVTTPCSSGTTFDFVVRPRQLHALVQRTTGRCMDIPGLSTSENALVQTYPCNRGGNQLFVFDASGKYFMVSPLHSGKCIAAPSAYPTQYLRQKTCLPGAHDHNWRLRLMANGAVKLVQRYGACMTSSSGHWLAEGSCTAAASDWYLQ